MVIRIQTSEIFSILRIPNVPNDKLSVWATGWKKIENLKTKIQFCSTTVLAFKVW